MKARSKIFSKAKLFVLMAALTLVICFPVAAATNSTTLTTTIPKTATLLLELTGNGTVAVNGVAYTEPGTVEIPRNWAVELLITPDIGNEIKSVVYNGQDYTKEAKAGKITLPAITGEATLCVSFTEIATAPQTGDFLSPSFFVFLMLLSLVAIDVTRSFRKKELH